MNFKRSGRQHGNPLLISSLEMSAKKQILIRKHFSQEKSVESANYDEWWLQRLLHMCPQSLPIQELEPGIGELIPIGMEMEMPSGYVDNVFVTAEGNIVIAECKLWRNPEARRQVIAQVIDYAQSMSKWLYEDFDAALRKSINEEKKPVGGKEKGLFDILKEKFGGELDIDEATFIDAISHNLRLGRILLLVVGDGIREGTETLVDYLQMHAGFHFILGMVEVAVFEVPGQGFIIQPRLMVRTCNIERAIVRLVGEGISIEPSVVPCIDKKSSRTSTMSEDIFFESLRSKQPATATALQVFLEKAQDCGVFLDPATKSAGLKWQAPSGQTFNLGGITLNGALTTYQVGWVPVSIGLTDLAHDYLENLSRIIGGRVRKTQHEGQWYVVKNGLNYPEALDALQADGEWLTLIEDYTNKLAKAASDL